MATIIERLEAEYVLQQCSGPYLDAKGEACSTLTQPQPAPVRGYEVAQRIALGRKVLERQARAVQTMIDLLEGTPPPSGTGKPMKPLLTKGTKR